MPMLLRKATRRAPAAALPFDETKHPREPKGAVDPKYKPGEFVPKAGAGTATAPARPASTSGDPIPHAGVPAGHALYHGRFQLTKEKVGLFGPDGKLVGGWQDTPAQALAAGKARLKAAAAPAEQPAAAKPTAKPAAAGETPPAKPRSGRTAKPAKPSEGQYRVSAKRLAELSERLAYLNKKAAKLGLPAVAMEVLKREKEEDREHPGLIREWVTVRVIGQEPQIAGWRFLGVIQHKRTEQGARMNVLRALGKHPIPEKYRSATKGCDHCHTERERNDTYVLQHVASGKTAQVGRNCLRDYVGHGDPQAIARWLEELGDWEDEAGDKEKFLLGGDEMEDKDGRPRAWVRTSVFLPHAAVMMRKAGWVPRSKADEAAGVYATADLAYNNLLDAMKKRKHEVPSPADRKLAEEALQWIRSRPKSWREGNEYRGNLYAAAATDELEPRELGLMASLIPVYQREKQEELERGKQQVSRFQGEPGERIGRVVTVTNVRPMDGAFGTTYLTSMVDAEGNRYKWFDSSGNAKLQQGMEIQVVGTVKPHEEFRGVQETQLTRCKVAPTLPAVERLFQQREQLAALNRRWEALYDTGGSQYYHGWKLKNPADAGKAQKLEAQIEKLGQELEGPSFTFGLTPPHMRLDPAVEAEHRARLTKPLAGMPKLPGVTVPAAAPPESSAKPARGRALKKALGAAGVQAVHYAGHGPHELGGAALHFQQLGAGGRPQGPVHRSSRVRRIIRQRGIAGAETATHGVYSVHTASGSHYLVQAPHADMDHLAKRAGCAFQKALWLQAVPTGDGRRELRTVGPEVIQWAA